MSKKSKKVNNNATTVAPVEPKEPKVTTARFTEGQTVRLTANAHYSIDGRVIPDQYKNKDLIVDGFGIVPELVIVKIPGTEQGILVGALFVESVKVAEDNEKTETTEE